MNNRMRITADRHPWNVGVELRLGVENGDGSFNTAKKLEFCAVEPGEIVEPFIRLDPESAQCLIDELWRLGLRPSQEYGSTGQASAMTKHLDDMRTIAFHALKVKP